MLLNFIELDSITCDSRTLDSDSHTSLQLRVYTYFHIFFIFLYKLLIFLLQK